MTRTAARAVEGLGVEEPEMGFQVERVESADRDGRVRFRYVIDASAELLIEPEWWEQLGRPALLWVSIRRDSE